MILTGNSLDVLRTLPNDSVQACITSPPYYNMRSYGTDHQIWDGDVSCSHVWGDSIPFAKQDNRSSEEKSRNSNVGNNIKTDKFLQTTSGQFCTKCDAWLGELGLEPTVQLYLKHLLSIFNEVIRIIKPDGIIWVNIGDSYSGSGKGYGSVGDKKWAKARDGKLIPSKDRSVKRKSLMSIPSRFEIAMVDTFDLVLRNEIHWHKPAAIPSPTKDRFCQDFEKIFLFTKNPIYKFNHMTEPTTDGSGSRTMRTTWSINFEPNKKDHHAKYPTKLIEPMIKASTDEGDVVLDPFGGTHTTGIVAEALGRQYIGIDLINI